jgi:hypothetical protein
VDEQLERLQRAQSGPVLRLMLLHEVEQKAPAMFDQQLADELVEAGLARVVDALARLAAEIDAAHAAVLGAAVKRTRYMLS